MFKHRNSVFFMGTLAAITVFCLPAAPARAEDKIVAVVNKDVITDKDLRDFTAFIRVQMVQNEDDASLQQQIETVQRGLLDRMIEDKLMLQDAAAAGVKVDQGRLRDRIREIKKRYASTAEFQEDLFRHGLTQGDIEKKIREQMTLQSIVESRIRDKIAVKPEEVTQYYNENEAAFTRSAGRQVDIISADSDDVARNAARDVRQGDTLEVVGKRYGVTVNSLTAARGNDLDPVIEQRIFSLDAGQVSEPEAIADRYYVFRVKGDVPAAKQPLTDAAAEIRSILYRQKMREAMESWLADLKKNAYIKKF